MPKNKFQEIIFTLLMVIGMVYAMVVYNIALSRGGLTDDTFIIALQELPLMGLIAFVVEFLVVGNIVKMIAFSMINPREEKGYVIKLVISSITVCLMCPIMSMVATVLYQVPGQQLFSSWVTTAVFNFPMALSWQLFFCGPAVRYIFSKIFQPQPELARD